MKTLLRPLVLSLALVTTASVARAVTPLDCDPPPLGYSHLFDVGGPPLFNGADVEAFRSPAGGVKYLFAADSVMSSSGVFTYRVLRYAGDGRYANSALIIASSASLISALAVNDIPGSCHHGQVYAAVRYTLGGGEILVLSPSGTLIAKVLCSQAWSPYDIALDSEGNLYVTGTTSILRFDEALLPTSQVADPITLTPSAVIPLGLGTTRTARLDLDANDNLYVTTNPNDSSGVRLRVFARDGTFLQQLGPQPTSFMGVCTLGRHFRCALSDPDLTSHTLCGSSLLPSGDVSLPSAVWPWRISYVRGDSLALLGGGLNLVRRCQEKLFVADPVTGKISVYGKTFTSTPVPSGAVAFWRFEKSLGPCGSNLIHDSVGTNPGLPLGPDVFSGEGLCGHGLEFRGALGGFSVTDTNTLDFATTSFTIEGWLRTEQETGTVTLVDKRVGTGPGYHAVVLDGHAGIDLNGWTFSPATAENFVADGKWHHFATVVDRSLNQVLLYVDGVSTPSMKSGPLPAGSLANAGDLFVGLPNPSASGTALFGGLDELTLFGRALSASEVAAIVLAESAGKMLPFSFPVRFPPFRHI